jgi:hypothetical protein
LIKEGEWDNNEFIKMQERLLKGLQIKHIPIDNKVILEKVKSNDEKLDKLEKLEEKLEKLDKLEKLEEKLEKSEKSDKLEILGKLETLEKSHCEILVKLEKLLERK